MKAEEAHDLTEAIRLEVELSGIAPDAFLSMAEFVACDLATLEAVVDEGLETFVRVGLALMAIRERRLYLDSHSSFDAYCRERWGMDRTYAHRTIAAAQTASVLPIGNRPENESQARPLAKLSEPAEIREAWEDAKTSSNGKPTAAAVASAVERIQQRKAAEPSSPARPLAAVQDTPQDEPSVADVEVIVPWSFKKEVTPHEPQSARDAAGFFDQKVIKNGDLWHKHLDHFPARLRRAALVEAEQQAAHWQEAIKRLSRPAGPRSA